MGGWDIGKGSLKTGRGARFPRGRRDDAHPRGWLPGERFRRESAEDSPQASLARMRDFLDSRWCIPQGDIVEIDPQGAVARVEPKRSMDRDSIGIDENRRTQ